MMTDMHASPITDYNRFCKIELIRLSTRGSGGEWTLVDPKIQFIKMINFTEYIFMRCQGTRIEDFWGGGGGHKTDIEPSLSVDGHKLGAILYIWCNHGSTNDQTSTVNHQYYGPSFEATIHLPLDKFLLPVKLRFHCTCNVKLEGGWRCLESTRESKDGHWTDILTQVTAHWPWPLTSHLRRNWPFTPRTSGAEELRGMARWGTTSRLVGLLLLRL